MASHGLQVTTPPLGNATAPTEGILKTIMGMRGLSIDQESAFDFELPPGSPKWPFTPYGPDSPHFQYANGRKPIRKKRNPAIASPARPVKARKPKSASTVNPKSEPRRDHGTPPPRDQPLHLLSLPGELRDIIYDILCLRKDPLYVQLRPILHRDGRKMRKVIRRHPLEPVLALVNKQLRREVLSVFYGANSFILRRSSEALLERYSMTDPQHMMRFVTPATCFLRSVELKVEAKGSLGFSFTFSHKLRKSQAGEVTISHSLVKSYCSCLEDDAIAQVIRERITRRVGSDLAGLAALLSTQRQYQISAVAREDREEGGMFRMPTATCVLCHRANLAHVSAGV